MNKTKALLLINLGTPDTPSYWSVYKFLKQFLMDKRVLDYPYIFRFLLVNFIIFFILDRLGVSQAIKILLFFLVNYYPLH